MNKYRAELCNHLNNTAQEFRPEEQRYLCSLTQRDCVAKSYIKDGVTKIATYDGQTAARICPVFNISQHLASEIRAYRQRSKP